MPAKGTLSDFQFVWYVQSGIQQAVNKILAPPSTKEEMKVQTFYTTADRSFAVFYGTPAIVGLRNSTKYTSSELPVFWDTRGSKAKNTPMGGWQRLSTKLTKDRGEITRGVVSARLRTILRTPAQWLQIGLQPDGLLACNCLKGAAPQLSHFAGLQIASCILFPVDSGKPMALATVIWTPCI